MILKAGPEFQAELLKGLGLSGYIMTDGNNPINLFNTANGTKIVFCVLILGYRFNWSYYSIKSKKLNKTLVASSEFYS